MGYKSLAQIPAHHNRPVSYDVRHPKVRHKRHICTFNFKTRGEVMKILAGIIGGLILAILGAIVIAIGGATNPGKSGSYGAIAFFILWIAGIVVAVTAPSPAKAWRRLLIASAVFAFLLPLSGVIFTGSHVASTMEKGGQYAGAAATGAAIGGTLVSGFMGIVGFFLGAVFLVIGLLVGREKQIIYLQAPPSKTDA